MCHSGNDIFQVMYEDKVVVVGGESAGFFFLREIEYSLIKKLRASPSHVCSTLARPAVENEMFSSWQKPVCKFSSVMS